MSGSQNDQLVLLRAILDSSDDAIISKNLDGIITSWNKGAERLFGYTAAEAIGKSVTILFPPDRIAEEPAILSHLKRGERLERFETIRRSKDGTLLDISLTISPLRDESGVIIGGSKVARDSRELQRGERAHRLLSAIVDSSDDAIISKNLDGIITTWNKSAERLFGYTAEEVIGRPITILIPTDRLEEEPQIISRLKRGERVEHFETIRRRKDGTLLDISLTISPVHNGRGEIIGASKIARDITRSKKMTTELQRSNAVLEQFAYSASHDLQEPLRTVKVYGQILLQKHGSQLDADGLAALHFLQRGANRMEALVRDLLVYTRVTKFEQPRENVDANAIFESAVATLAGSIAENHATVECRGPLPTLRVHSAHLEQLFQNLIGNAIKYRRPDVAPAVVVRAARRPSYWEFSIEDNGIGIEPQYLTAIFALFKRLHGPDQYPGSGLGLAICQRIIEQYDGRIWVESDVAKGSVFRFLLPL